MSDTTRDQQGGRQGINTPSLIDARGCPQGHRAGWEGGMRGSEGPSGAMAWGTAHKALGDGVRGLGHQPWSGGDCTVWWRL